jgi:hypothetical protein
MLHALDFHAKISFFESSPHEKSNVEAEDKRAEDI